MKTLNTILSALKLPIVKSFILCFAAITLATSCEREPVLHLHRGNMQLQLPVVDVDLDVIWDYDLVYDTPYDWRSEWYYGDDPTLFGGIGEEYIGYRKPGIFELRRYFTGDVPNAPHSRRENFLIEGYTFSHTFDWGYHDLLVWNYILPVGNDEAISTIIDERATLDSVFAYTNRTSRNIRLPNRAETIATHYQPEELFSAYERAFEVDRDLTGFVWDEERQLYVKNLKSTLKPLTYIYLTQIVLHGNGGRIVAVDGEADITGMASKTNVNTGHTGLNPVGVNYSCGFKQHIDYKGEDVDIVGGRVLTFGLCGLNGSAVSRGPISEEKDPSHHYIDCTFVFNNGAEKTMAFDVTDQVRKLFKGACSPSTSMSTRLKFPTSPAVPASTPFVVEREEEIHEIPIVVY